VQAEVEVNGLAWGIVYAKWVEHKANYWSEETKELSTCRVEKDISAMS